MMRLEHIVDLIKAVTGWENISLGELIKAGERAITMSRSYNIREGKGSDDDIPDRMHKPIKSGIYQGTSMDKDSFEEAKKLYYEIMGWNLNGAPGVSKLIELDISWIDKMIDNKSNNYM